MFDSVSPAEGEPIGVVSSGWLWAARWSALICTIALGVGFVAVAADHYSNAMLLLLMFGRWGSLSLALLYLLFRRGKNSLAFALGLGAATAFIALLAVASSELHLAQTSNLIFAIMMFSGVSPPFSTMGYNGLQLAKLGALLLWPFGLSLAMLGLSSIVAFQKMAHEAKGMGKLRLAFGAGIFCGPVVWLIFILLWLLLIGSFHM